MMDWLTSLRQRLYTAPAVRVTIATVKGSAPRAAGTCMLIGGDWQEGTIGGGHLELLATGIARDMLRADASVSGRLDRFPLGATLGQCCGGIVELWFERYSVSDLGLIDAALQARRTGSPLWMATALSPDSAERHRFADRAPSVSAGVRAVLAKDPAGDTLYERLDSQTTPLWLFGAGHVGKALIDVMRGLPFAITWIDSRDAMFPPTTAANLRILGSDDPAAEVRAAPANAMFLVLTHSHDLDFDICRAILDQRDFAWAGLIGSATKAARFKARFAQRGYAPAEIARIVCPIGIDGIASKLPAAIAVAVAAQVLRVAEALAATSASESFLQSTGSPS